MTSCGHVCLRERRPVACLFLWLLLVTVPAHGETKLDFWHTYIHQPSGVPHYSFQIASYKRGLFFGSCGPSTRSLRWHYDIDLAGSGPLYRPEQITITVDGKTIPVLSGSIRVDSKAAQAIIALQVRLDAGPTDLAANGTHRITKLK